MQNKIIANVGSQIITSHELKNTIITSLVLNNQEINQENVNRNKGLAIQSLVNYKLKKGEVSKFNITPNNEAVNNHLERIASRYNANIDELKKIFSTNGLDYELYLDEIKIEFAWQKLVYQIYNKKVFLDDTQINEELKQLIEKQKNLQEYELAEIEILLENSSEDKQNIKEIKKEISISGFENTAIKYSASTSAIEGGKLGWVNAGALSSDISNELKAMSIGEVSKPIFRANSVLLIKLLIMKKTIINNQNIEELKKNIIINKKNELLGLFSNSHLTKIKNNTLINIK